MIEPGYIDRNYWRQLWDYRELFLILAWRDVAIRYKQTVFGVSWAVLRPFLTMLAFTLVFGMLAKLPSDAGAPYPLMVLAGILPWLLFSSILTGAADSIVGNANLVGKVYFPRMIMPASTVITAMVDFSINCGLLLVIMMWYQYVPTWRIALLPAFILLAVIASVGPGLLLSALNAEYRDFRYVIPFVLQIGLYISPVGFSSSIVPAEWRLLYSLNPLVGIIDGFRWCILGAESQVHIGSLIASVGIAMILTVFGVATFRARERSFADVV